MQEDISLGLEKVSTRDAADAHVSRVSIEEAMKEYE